MNITKVLCIFFALFIALGNCSVIKSDSNDEDDGDSNVVVIVPSAVLKIIQTVVSAITNFGINAINGLSDSSGVIEENVRSLEEKLVDLLWNVINNKLDDMENDASDFTKAVIKCVKEQGDFLKTMVFNFASQSVTCEIEKTIMNFNTYLPMLTDIRDTNDEMKNLTQQLIECGNDAAAMPCIYEVHDKIYSEINALINTLKIDIADASKFIDNNAKFASWCHQDASAKFQEKLQEVSAIEQCIEENYPKNVSV